MLLSISGGSDLGLFEINEAAQLVTEAAHPEANIIFGAVIDDALGDEVRVTVIAAGFDGGQPPGPSRDDRPSASPLRPRPGRDEPDSGTASPRAGRRFGALGSVTPKRGPGAAPSGAGDADIPGRAPPVPAARAAYSDSAAEELTCRTS